MKSKWDLQMKISGEEGKNLINGRPLRNDNVLPDNSIVRLSSITHMPSRKGLECAVISAGQIVNVVSDGYGHLPNEQFFLKVEEKLIEADIQYVTRSINRENRSFAVDYILNDDSLHIDVKNGKDKLRPMLRFINSYDGSNKTSGHFGYFREVCANGLHVAQTNIGFSVKHKGDIVELVLPEINHIVKRFMDNEYYTLKRKFEVLAEKPITDIEHYVRLTTEELKLFMFQCSEKNPAPSLNARMVIDTIRKESRLLGVEPNMWLGYNAFNEVIHDKLKKTFEAQKTADMKLFTHAMEMAN